MLGMGVSDLTHGLVEGYLTAIERAKQNRRLPRLRSRAADAKTVVMSYGWPVADDRSGCRLWTGDDQFRQSRRSRRHVCSR